MQRIVLTTLALGASAIPIAAQPLSLDSGLYPPNYSRASLESPYLPADTRPAPRLVQHVPAQAVAQPMVRRAHEPAPRLHVRSGRAAMRQPVYQAEASAPRPAVRHDGGLGGGFIEFLFSGPDRSRANAAVPPHVIDAPPQSVAMPEPMAAPAELMPGPIESIYGSSRTASLPSVQLIRPAPAMDTKYLPTIVDYNGKEKPGTVIINTPERFLYLVMEGGMAKRYGIGVGRPGFTWAGSHKVTAKREWPDWHPPQEMLKRQPQLPDFMPGGPDNPLGARALYLGSTLYRIHGSNEPWTIGRAVSSGCIRMRNQDVIDLYDRVGVGAKVVVI
jgi:lipoprotein-anchoring transpeptidase ErfK/SrfK